MLGLGKPVRDRNITSRIAGAGPDPELLGSSGPLTTTSPLLPAPPTRRRLAPTPSMDTESASGLAVRPCVKTWASLSSRCHPHFPSLPAFSPFRSLSTGPFTPAGPFFGLSRQPSYCPPPRGLVPSLPHQFPIAAAHLPSLYCWACSLPTPSSGQAAEPIEAGA